MDGLVPALLGLCFFAAGTIYLVVSLISYVFVKRELTVENIEFDNNQNSMNQLRKNKLLGVSLATYSVNVLVFYRLTRHSDNTSYLLIVLIAVIFITSYLGLAKQMKFAKPMWIAVLIYLLVSSIIFLIVSIGRNKSGIFYIGLPIAYLYTISVLVKSKIINTKIQIE